MDGLVGVIVVLVPQEVLWRLVEEGIQVGKHFLASAHQLHHPCYVVRHEPALLIGIALDAAVAFPGAGVRWPCFPFPIGLTGTEPAHGGVEDVAVGLTFLDE